MAQQFAVNVYKINSQPAIPLASVTALSFPSAGVLIRGAAQLLSTGVSVYSIIQTADNTQYYSMQTQAALTTAANA